jgi:SAM-dependent methyltransferase
MVGHNIGQLEQRQIIGGGRRFAGCYKCNSDDRERLIFVYLKEKLGLFSRKDVKILHIAPEKNLSAKLFSCGFSEYICGDLFTPGYRYPAYVRNMNVLDMPFSENHFDVVICNHVFEHIPDDLHAMKEVSRVLKKGGEAILQVPMSKTAEKTFEDFSISEPQAREVAFGQSDHVRLYGRDYADRLASSGFAVKRINISRQFPRFGLNPDEDIFVGTK